MSCPKPISEFVRDALAARYMEGRGCFWSNQSSRLLQEMGEPVLPTIEAVIVAEVLPFYHCPEESLQRKFPGLLSLLVTYFAVGKDTGSDRFIPFFRRLYGSLRSLAMRAISIVWLSRRPTAALPESLLMVIREIAGVGSGEVQQAALWLLERNEEQSEG